MFEDELTDKVKEAAKDIVAEYLPKLRLSALSLTIIDVDHDDGTVYGDYAILVNRGEATILLTATALYSGFEDCWNESNESHYTRDFVLDELEGFDYEVTNIQRFDEALDRVVNVDIDMAREER